MRAMLPCRFLKMKIFMQIVDSMHLSQFISWELRKIELQLQKLLHKSKFGVKKNDYEKAEKVELTKFKTTEQS